MKSIVNKIITCIVFLLTFCLSSYSQENNLENAQLRTSLQIKEQAFNFFVISDWGWNGYKHQQEVADEMGLVGESIEPKFIVSCGDNFQLSGVASTQDPLWLKNFENVYTNLSLQVEWFPVFGNHDYKGNTQAEIDYTNISRRWRMESHYYSFVRKINDSISARFIFLDTPPLVDEYYKKPGYLDVFKQDSAKQIKWLSEELANSKEQWKLVFGHHPIYSASKTHGNTPDMIRKVRPLLEKYNAQIYFCGHDHDFQLLEDKNRSVDYIVTGTGGEPRPASTNDLSVFSKSAPGFSLVSFSGDSIKVNFVDAKGELLYTMKRSYKRK